MKLKMFPYIMKKYVTIFLMGLFAFCLPHRIAIAASWTQLFPTGTPPSPRYGAHAYDEANDRLILFSGEVEGGIRPTGPTGDLRPRPTDVWVLKNATGHSGQPNWTQLFPSGPGPVGRVGGTSVYDSSSNRMIVHGGCVDNCGPSLSDTWALTNANGLGGTPTWTVLPSAPIGRSGHTANYDPTSNRMIVFGGDLGYSSLTTRNDVWVLTDANGIGSPTWMQLFPDGIPPAARIAHASVYDPVSNRLIVYGGVAPISSQPHLHTYFNDVWVLSHANGLGGTPTWTQLSPTGIPPTARGSHSTAYNPSSNRMIVFGGAISSGPQLGTDPAVSSNDVWIFTNANGVGGTPTWIQITPTGCLPVERLAASTGYAMDTNKIVIAYGRNDNVPSGLTPDVWVLSLEGTTTTKPCSADDTTPPEAINTFDPATLDVALLGTDDLSGVESVILLSSVSVGNGMKLQTYLITDNAGNTLTLVEKVKNKSWSRGKKGYTKAEIVSLKYNGGGAITPPRNKKIFKWELNADGSLKRLVQTVSVRGTTTVFAKYQRSADKTMIRMNGVWETRPGLVLLQMVTNAGALGVKGL